ncbi:MAG: hypothetical protein ABSF60_01315 [Verrucomicrobiota bacterium]|jgi:amino acid transporter
MKINLRSGKSPAWMSFIIVCACFFISLVGCVFDSEARFVWILFMIGSAFIAGYIGYRVVFFSDDWFRMKQEREALWWDKNRILGIIGWVLLFAFVAYKIWRHFGK